MRQPRDLYTTMNGLFAVQLMAALQTIVDLVLNGLGGQDWGVFDWIRQSLLSAVLDITQSIVATMFPGAPGASDYLIAAPEALADVAGNIATTLVEMQAQRRYVQYQFIPAVQAYDIGVSYGLFYQLSNTVYSLYYSTINALYSNVGALYGYINREVSYLSSYVAAVQQSLYVYIGRVYDTLVSALNQAVVNANNRMDALNIGMRHYVDSVASDLRDAIDTAKLELTLAIGALGTFISVVEIPGALAAFKVEQTAEIAAGMDVLYPVAAASVDKAALEFALSLPQVSARALDVPPEAVPGIGGMAEALTAATVFETAVTSNACAPLWTKLHEFADDTAELDGVVSTVLLAGLVTAMTLAPEATATVVADVIAGPLNDMGTRALSLIGLG